MEGQWKFQGREGWQQQSVKRKDKVSMELNWNFQRVGVETKKPSVGCYGCFLDDHNIHVQEHQNETKKGNLPHDQCH